MPKLGMPVTTVKHRGFFDYETLMKAIRGWYSEEDFNRVDIPKYVQKYPTPTGTEFEVEFHGEKKVTEYVRYHIDVYIRVFNMRDVEIVQEGEKLRMQDGQVHVEVRPALELDWQKRFEGNRFLQALHDFYRNYIIRYKISDYWEDMTLILATKLVTRVKQTLGQEVM